jgi:hypothetical protein
VEAAQLGPRFHVVKTSYSTSMSSLWTPSGEHFVNKEEAGAASPPPTPPGDTDVTDLPDAESQEQAQAAVDAMRAQLAGTPAEVVVANHCYGLFELAAIYLSQNPPELFEARLAIDGLTALLQGLTGRLGEAEPALLESLSQLQLAYVQLEGAERAAAEAAAASDAGTGEQGPASRN